MIETVSKDEATEEVVRRVVGTLPATLIGAAVSGRLCALFISPTIDAAKRCGELLQSLGFVSHAETLFHALALHFPHKAAGPIGLAQIAMHRKQWKLALLRWNALMSNFPRQNNFYWLTARAQALDELGLTAEAAVILTDLVRDFAEQPFLSIGRARSAMRHGLWTKAVEGWDELLAAFPDDHAVPHWKIARATSLIELGRQSESEAELRHVIQADPWMLPALHTLMRCYCSTGRYAAALKELQTSIFADAQLPVLFPLKMQILIALSQFDVARATFSLYLQHAGDLESLETLFTEAPRLHEGWRLTEIQIDILRRLDALPASTTVDNTASVNVLRARSKLALKDISGFQAAASLISIHSTDRKVERSVRAIAAAVSEPRFPDYYRPRIFGIGLSRTGTTTLASALSALGLNTLHWTNPLTGQLISDADLHLFDAFTDLPSCISFERHFYLFPNAKFIYTTRPINSWLDSFARHWQHVHNLSDFQKIKDAFSSNAEFHYGSYFREIHFQLFFRHPNAAEAYAAYDQRVREFFNGKPQERFLEFSVFNGDGWPELCRFLGTDIPNVPFPFENSGAR